MGDIPEELTRRSLRATLAGDGRPGPIEVRIGRRLVRLVDPGSDEGRQLLHSGAVELVGPGGESFGRIAVAVAWRQIEARLATRLDGATENGGKEGLEASLERVRALEAQRVDS
jgi:hypothetical protein